MAAHLTRRRLLLAVTAAVAMLPSSGRTEQTRATEKPPRPKSGVTPTKGALRVHPMNPRYFTDGSGKAIYLTGSHTWRNMQDSTNVPDFGVFLDFLQRYGHNYTRLWVYRGTPGGPALTPTVYARTGPGTALDGGLKYDLSRFNQAFFDQLRARCIAARDRGIYVQVMLDSSETARTEPPGNVNWPFHPYNLANNINGVNGDPNGDQWGYEIFTLQVAALTALNESYARKVVDTLNDLDNVLYEIVNEANHDSKDFQYHMIKYIQSYEAANKPKRHPVGMTSYRDPGNESGGANSDLVASPADYISPGQGNVNPYKDNPPTADGRKVIILDTDHIGGGDATWVWKTFTRGMNPIYMDTWEVSDATLEKTRRAMGQTRKLAERINLAAMEPRPDLASTGYCLAHAGVAYLVYQPDPGESFSVEVKAGTYRYALLSGLIQVEQELGFIERRWFSRRTIDNGAQVEAMEKGALDFALDFQHGEGTLRPVFEQRHEKKSDHGNADLSHHCIQRGAQEGFHLEVLFDPLEEEFHLPAAFV
jgi:hypothetical protein